ncbi:MAG: type II secretion system F family protein [Candidatus Paceibacterota bacterium]
MPVFNYKAQKAEGEIYESSAEFSDRFALYNDLKRRGEMILSIHEVKSKAGNRFSFDQLFGRVGTHEQILFARNLGSMISSGLSLTRALNVILKQTKNKAFQSVITSILGEIGRGQSLAQALSVHPKVFSSLFVSMVRAGESSGSLSDSLKVVSRQMEQSYLLKKKIRGAMMYPGIILSVMLVIGVLMMIYVVPTLTGTFKELKVALPASTQFILNISNFIINHTILGLVIVIAVIVGFITLLKTKPGKRGFDWTILKLPVIGSITKETNSARTARTLSSLLSAGVSVVEALGITAEVTQNSYYHDVLKHAEEAIQKGITISSVFAENEKLYPTFVAEMTSVGEETGQLAPMLLELATYYEAEVEQRTKDMSTIIEPFLMVVIGAAVGFFAISMISPMYSLVNTI